MAISDEDIQKVREATDLAALMGERSPLKQRGRDVWCCCPFHNEKTPSCKIDTVNQLWHCFGCGEGGDVFSYIMKLEDLSFIEAVRRLAERAHIEISDSATASRGATASKKARLKKVCEATAAFYHEKLMRDGGAGPAAARSYLSGRALGGKIPNNWNLGFAPGRGSLVRHLSAQGFRSEEMVEANVALVGKDGKLRDRFYNRVMFPINDEAGECIAFGGRVLDKSEPKYLNTQETPIFHKGRTLYALDKAKVTMASTGVAIVCEGYTDVIAMHEAGITNAVATLGTALTKQHIRVLSRHARNKIVYLFDGDAAGQRAADRALQFIDVSMTPEAGRSRVELCAVTLPNNQDPAEFIGSFAAPEEGGVALRELVDNAQPLLKYGIDRRLARWDLNTAEGRSAALSDALSVLAPIKDSVLAKDYAVQIASQVRAREQDVLTQLAKLKAPRAFDDENAAQQGKNPTTNAAPTSAHAGSSGRISAAERSRRKCERRLLALVAQHPELALLYADTLAQTQWHDPVCAAASQSLLDTLASNPAAAPADLISHAAQVVPAAASILTSADTVVQVGGSQDASATAAFLAEELSLGDAEDAIAGMKATLANPSSLSPEEYDMVFQTVAAMQKDLTVRRNNHNAMRSLA